MNLDGTVTAVVRGDRRKVLRVTVKADAQQEYAEFGVTADYGKFLRKTFKRFGFCVADGGKRTG